MSNQISHTYSIGIKMAAFRGHLSCFYRMREIIYPWFYSGEDPELVVGGGAASKGGTDPKFFFENPCENYEYILSVPLDPPLLLIKWDNIRRCTWVVMQMQCWIQDFSDRGTKSKGPKPIIRLIFATIICMKIKKIGPRGGALPLRPQWRICGVKLWKNVGSVGATSGKSWSRYWFPCLPPEMYWILHSEYYSLLYDVSKCQGRPLPKWIRTCLE